MTRTITLIDDDGAQTRVVIPDGRYFYVSIFGSDTGDLDDYDAIYSRDLMVAAADASTARAAAAQTCDPAKSESVELVSPEREDMAALFQKHDGMTLIDATLEATLADEDAVFAAMDRRRARRGGKR